MYRIEKILIDIENIDVFKGTKDEIQELRDKQVGVKPIFSRVLRVYTDLSEEVESIDKVKYELKQKVFEIIKKSRSVSDLNTKLDRYFKKRFKGDLSVLLNYYKYITRKNGFKRLKLAHVDNIYIRMETLKTKTQ